MGWWQAWTRRLRSLRRETHALLLACRDARTPWYAKFLAGVVLAYALSPIDLIPDFIPVLGLLDDLILVPLGVMLVRQLVPADVLTDCRAQAECASEQSLPTSRAGVVLIVTLWVVTAYVAYALIWGRLR